MQHRSGSQIYELPNYSREPYRSRPRVLKRQRGLRQAIVDELQRLDIDLLGFFRLGLPQGRPNLTLARRAGYVGDIISLGARVWERGACRCATFDPQLSQGLLSRALDWRFCLPAPCRPRPRPTSTRAKPSNSSSAPVSAAGSTATAVSWRGTLPNTSRGRRRSYQKTCRAPA